LSQLESRPNFDKVIINLNLSDLPEEAKKEWKEKVKDKV